MRLYTVSRNSGNYGNLDLAPGRLSAKIQSLLYGQAWLVALGCVSTRQTPPSSRCRFTGRDGTCSPSPNGHKSPGSAPFTSRRLCSSEGLEIHIAGDSSGVTQVLPWFLADNRINSEEGIMLYWTIVFLVIALIAGVLGFTGVAVAAAGIAKLLFFVFLVLFVISLVTHLARRGSV